MEESYIVKLSLPALIIHLIIDCLLMIIFVGFFSFIHDLLVYFTTHLEFTRNSVHGRTGIIRIKALDMPLNKINSVSVTQGLIGRLFNYGTLIITGSFTGYEYHFVSDPNSVKNILNDCIAHYNESGADKIVQAIKGN